MSLCVNPKSAQGLCKSGTIPTGSGHRAIYSLPHHRRTDAPVHDPEYHGYTAEKRACEPWRRMLIGSFPGKRLPDAYFDSPICRRLPFLPPSSKTCIYTTITQPSSTSLHFGSPASGVPSTTGRIYGRNWLV